MILALLTLLPIDLSLVPGPAEIAIWAMEDAATEHAAGEDVSGFRYVWIHRADEADCIEDARVIDLAPVNMVLSKSSNIIPSHRVNSRLLRIDLNQLGVTTAKAKKLRDTWEKLRDLDRYVTATENELAVTTVDVITETPIKVESTVLRLATPGESLTLGVASPDPAWVRIVVEGQTAYVAASAVKAPAKGDRRTIGPQCGDAGIDLAELVGSEIPIVRHDFLLRTVMSGDFILRPLGQDGGLYYEFLQIDKAAADSGKNDLQVWLETFGADLQESQKLRTDVGSVLVRSNVTGRSRVAVAIRGRGGKPGVSDGVVYGTFDSKVGDDFNADLDPWENLLGFNHQASEWIAPLPNGLHAYGLFAGDFNGQNFERQDFAPDDVANDSTVPQPHSDRLVVGLCWRCHNTAETDRGLKPSGNDLATLLSRGRDILTAKQDEADTIAGRYSGDFDRVIDESRDSFSRAVFRATRDPANRLEGMTPFEAFGRLAAIYHAYWYDLVTPETALMDLGLIGDEDAAARLRKQLRIADVGESSALVLLASGIPVNRWQWENVYPEAVLRARETVESEPMVDPGIGQ